MEKQNIPMEENNTIASYSKLLQALVSNESLSFEKFKDILNQVAFVEDYADTFNGLPVMVQYVVLPVVTGGPVDIKVVLVSQVDSIALVLPEDILEIYSVLEEEPDREAEMNVDFSLYAEIYGFDKEAPELAELLKRAYLKANNFGAAFTVVATAKKSPDKPEDSTNTAELDSQMPPMDSIDDTTMGSLDELKPNEESYRLFKKTTRFIEQFLAATYTKSAKIIKDNMRYRFLGNVLLLEINNNAIYNTLENVSKSAKKLISYLGESIRTNSNIQLLDSFTKNNRRYFVIAEYAGNNFWAVKGEDLSILTEDTSYIKPRTDQIIWLAKSNIRQESRRLQVYKENRDIIFTNRR